MRLTKEQQDLRICWKRLEQMCMNRDTNGYRIMHQLETLGALPASDSLICALWNGDTANREQGRRNCQQMAQRELAKLRKIEAQE